MEAELDLLLAANAEAPSRWADCRTPRRLAVIDPVSQSCVADVCGPE